MKLEDRHRRLLGALARLLQVLVVGLTLLYVGRAMIRNWGQVTELELGLSWHHPAALVLGMAYLWLRGVIWHDMMSKLVGSVPLRVDVACWLASQLGKYVPGKVMLVLGRVMIYKQRGLSVTRVASAVLLEMLALFATAALVTAVAPLLGDRQLPLAAQAASVVAFVVLVGLCHPRWLRLAEAVLRRLGLVVAEVPRYRFRDALLWILLISADWMVLGLGLFLLADSILPVQSGLFLPLASAFALAGTAGILVLVAPSGLGVREGVLTGLLSPVLGPGPAAVLSILARLWSTISEVLSALLALAMLRRASPARTPAALDSGEAKHERAP